MIEIISSCVIALQVAATVAVILYLKSATQRSTEFVVHALQEFNKSALKILTEGQRELNSKTLLKISDLERTVSNLEKRIKDKKD